MGNAGIDELATYGACYVGDTEKKVIYLTFDCGYENGYTEQILDVLKKHNAPAAFFVVGHMVESAPDIVRRMAAEGHIVGNTPTTTPDMSAIAEQEAFSEELTSLEALYRETTGQEMSRFYPPAPGEIQRGEPQTGPSPGLPDGVLEPRLRGLVHRQSALSGGGILQADSPDPRWGHRVAPLHLTHQCGDPGRAVDKRENMGYTFASLEELPDPTGNGEK